MPTALHQQNRSGKAEDVEKLKERLIAINPRCPIEPVNMGNLPVEKVLNICGFNMNDVLDIDPTFLTGVHHHHHDDVSAFVFESDRPFDAPRFDQYIQSLVAVYGQEYAPLQGRALLQADRPPLRAAGRSYGVLGGRFGHLGR